MENVYGWDKLLGDSFFCHAEGIMSPDDAQRLLDIIGEDIYLKKVSLSIDNKNLTIPESTTRIEAIGFKAEIAKDGLKQMLETTGETADTKEDADWTHRFLSEEEFQCYVFQLFDFLIACAQNLLPDSGQIPAFEDRAKATARDNAEEFEDEIEKVETARKSAQEAKKAAEEARAAAESIVPNMLTTLGVFIAIVIAVVACYLSVLLSHHAKEANTLNMAMILLMGHILLNIIFLLLYLISKMSVHSLACHCLVGDQMDCLKCDPTLREHCCFRHKLWLRYPYVVAMNGAFGAAYCVLALWYLGNHYFGASIDQMLTAHLSYAAAVLGVIAVLIIATGIILFQFFLRSPRRKVNAIQKKEQKAQKKEQKIQNERKIIRELQIKLSTQENRIELLEKDLKAITKELDSTLVK